MEMRKGPVERRKGLLERRRSRLGRRKGAAVGEWLEYAPCLQVAPPILLICSQRSAYLPLVPYHTFSA